MPRPYKKLGRVLFYPIRYVIIIENHFGAKTMENCINEKEMLAAALESIEGFCKLYQTKKWTAMPFARRLQIFPNACGRTRILRGR